jgi:hypothetical protein
MVWGVGSGAEGGLVAGETGVAASDDGLRVLPIRGGPRAVGCGLGCFQVADCLGEPVRREYDSEPAVDGGQDVGLAEVDVAAARRAELV